MLRPIRRSTGPRAAKVVQLVLCAALGMAALSPGASFAQQAVSKEDKKRAGVRFREAETLFQKHNYAEAADAFEDAFHIAPHPAVLWNVVNAAELAGQNARAAMICEQLTQNAGGDEKLRAEARQKLAELRPRVVRLELSGANAERILIDGKEVTSKVMFVDPGDHALETTFGKKSSTRKISVVAGATERILLERPSDDEPKAATTELKADFTSETEPKPSKPLSPAWVYVGAGLTVALGGVATWSGLDTISARKDYDDNPNRTKGDLDAGKSKQLRTNILIGTAAGVGLATVGVALFATNWGKGEKSAGQAKLKVGPAGAWLEGTF